MERIERIELCSDFPTLKYLSIYLSIYLCIYLNMFFSVPSFFTTFRPGYTLLSIHLYIYLSIFLSSIFTFFFHPIFLPSAFPPPWPSHAFAAPRRCRCPAVGCGAWSPGTGAAPRLCCCPRPGPGSITWRSRRRFGEVRGVRVLFFNGDVMET